MAVVNPGSHYRLAMKNIWWVIPVIIFFSLVMFLRLVELESRNQNVLFINPLDRKSITFLLGRDKADQSYFQLAEEHFLFDKKECTREVVKSCSSLVSLVEYLRDHAGDSPWGVINVVVHGNMWGGLSVPLWEEGPRAYPKELFMAASTEQFPKLDAKIVDQETRINFWACGIGKNPLINLGLEYIFTNSQGEKPNLYVSPHFVIFKKLHSELPPARIRASYWPYFYRRGYRPSESKIAVALKNQYPDADLDWLQAVGTTDPDTSLTLFRDEFHIPVVWTVLYQNKKSRPDVSTDALKMSWIRQQPELMTKVSDMQIPIEKYNWSVKKIIYSHPDGRKQPAIKAIGMCTVLCVVQPREG